MRFGDAPTGTQRFGAPQTPVPGVTPPDPEGQILCHQFHAPERDNGLVRVHPPYLGNQTKDSDIINETEDYLFLDLYVPKSVLEKQPLALDTPVIA